MTTSLCVNYSPSLLHELYWRRINKVIGPCSWNTSRIHSKQSNSYIKWYDNLWHGDLLCERNKAIYLHKVIIKSMHITLSNTLSNNPHYPTLPENVVLRNTSTWLRSSSSRIIITNHIQSKPLALGNTWTMTSFNILHLSILVYLEKHAVTPGLYSHRVLLSITLAFFGS